MDATQPSLQSLAHFDDAAAPAAAEVDALARTEPTRGIRWVLKWTSAMAVLFYSSTVLAEFGYALAAEQVLAHAARAGVLEATLPRATLRSVEQSVMRRLSGHVQSQSDVKLMLLDNGAWVSRKLQPRGGDRLTINLSMPAQALMPIWLRTFTSWRSDATIQARAERTMPGRKLSPHAQAGDLASRSRCRRVQLRVIQHPLLDQLAESLQIYLRQALVMIAAERLLVADGSLGQNFQHVVLAVRARRPPAIG